MAKRNKVLVVEGNADVFFFDAMLRELELNGVEVSPPASVRRANGKFHAIEAMEIFVKQLLDQSIERLGLVVDADTPLAGQDRGFAPTIRAVDEKLSGYGFSRTSRPNGEGFIYGQPAVKNSPKIYVWIMPDSCGDGALEHFVRAQVGANEVQRNWYQRAEAVVGQIADPLFNPDAHKIKAVTSTWLAWQKYPGKGMQSVVGDKLIDLEGGLAAKLNGWLRSAFQ